MDRVFYTLPEAAEILRVSEGTLRRRIKDGIVPKSRISGKILIPAGYIERERCGYVTEIRPVRRMRA